MPPLLLAVETAVSRAPQLSCQQITNCLTERQNPGAKSQAPLFGAPGLTEFSAVPNNEPCRGAWIFEEELYQVNGDTLYKIANSSIVTDVGGAVKIPGTDPVGMSDNGVQLIVVNGVQGWIYDPVGGLQLIVSDGFQPSDTVTFMDGYFLLCAKGTNQWFISGLYDGLNYDPLDFASAEAVPGHTVAIQQNLQLVFIFCSAHIELWYDAGSADFPFARYAGGVIDYGCIAPFSIVKQDGALFFLGVDKVFYRLQANVPIRISTHEIETVFEADPDLSQAETITYTLEGHKFIQVTLPESHRTLIFDISTGKWWDRESWGADFVSLGRYRARTAINVYQQILIGDAFDGRIGRLVWKEPTEYGNMIPLKIVTAPAHEDRKRLFVSRFELDVEAGVGTDQGQGVNPQVMLRYSRDGGKTWSLQQPWRSMGKAGEYGKRLRWLRMGNGRTWVWEITITDPVFRTIIAGHVDIMVGSA